MSLNLLNLDAETRTFMLSEIDLDREANKIYFSKRLSEFGRSDYLSLLKEAAQSQNDNWLAQQLRLRERINQTEDRRKPKGGIAVVSVPVTAPETLAEGEFNRFFIRGVCSRAIANNDEYVIVYRAKEVDQPRKDSEQKIGAPVNAKALLEDLRESIGVDTALGLPPGPNSGLSIRLP
jgi:hypothetical protein